jgi:hypothetical protein
VVEIPGRGEVPLTNIEQSVGGTCFGTTPGGTRLKYDPTAISRYRNTPLSTTPPPFVNRIPGVLRGTKPPERQATEEAEEDEEDDDVGTPEAASPDAELQFAMEE